MTLHDKPTLTALVMPDAVVKLSVNVNKVATVRNSRGGRLPSVTAGRATCASRPARPASPCTPGPTSGTSRPTDVREHRRVAGAAAGGRRVQHRRRPAARPAGSRRRGPADQCTLVPVQSRRGHQPGGLGRGRRRTTLLARAVRDMRAAGIRVEPVRRPGRRRDRLGRPASAPTAWSCIPSRSRGPSNRATPRHAPRSPSTVAAAERAHALGVGVNAGHDLDLRQPRRSSGGCRTSTRCRSATP